MAIEGEASFSAAAAAATSSYPTGGAGGKLTRQPARRHAATPYSRPPQNQIQRRPWISRIVDPAYRIISGGATRILPYFFSKATSAPSLTAPDDQDQHQDKLQNDDTQENVPSTTTSLNKLESASFEKGGPSGTANVKEGNFSISAQIRGETGLNDAVAISELERLMEGKSFSQAETDRLIEIITSRAVELPDVKRDERTLEISLREGAKKTMSFLDKRKEPIGGKDANSELWTTPTPLPKSIIFDKDKKIHDEAGLSPAELAKAYMGGQTSLSSSQGFVARNEKDCFDTGMHVGKSSLASPSSKPSACWPGIKSTEQSGFATPQRESFGLQNFPRTPYSRTILSNSKSKSMQLQNDSSKRLSNLQSPSQSVQTRYGQLSKGRDGGLFGPSRRSRQSTTPSIVSPYSRPSRGSSRFENSDIIKSSETGESDYLSRSQTTTYGKHKESEVVGTPTVPPHSSQLARNILDKIVRSSSNPRGKSAELKLATSWRYPQSSKTVEQSSSNDNNVKKDGSAKLNEDVQNIFSHNQSSFVLKPPANSTADTQNGMTKTAPVSNGIFRETQAAGSSGTAVQYELGKPKSSLSRSTHGEKIDVTSSQDAAKAVPYSFGGEPANLPKPPSHSLGNNKPVLPSISIAKPFQKWAVPSGTNAGFTFPVSSSDGATSSEPTTPSIMPFTTSPVPSGGIAVTSHHGATKDDEIPQYSFNSKRRDKNKSPLVFDFPSVSEEVINEEDDASLGIEFTFGSEKTERIPFGSAGSDGVCC